MIYRQLNENILPYLNYFPCIGILGPRQVGKTTFVRHLRQGINKEIIYLDLEDTNDFEILSKNAQWFLEQHIAKLVIIDEVQRELSLFPLLRALIDKTNSPCQFVLLGSASPELLAKSSETLAGRIFYFELTPFHLLELKDYSQEEHWFRGGYPKAFLSPSNKLWQAWHKSYLKTYIETDLRNIGLTASPILINKLLKMIASLQGGLLNYSELSKSLGVSSQTVKTYLELLQHTYIIRLLEPYYVNIGKRLVKSPKIYIRDSGILHALLALNNKDDLINHYSAGNSWEGYVIEQIITQLNDDCTPYFYRTQKGAELDLCIIKGQQPIVSIEIKLSNKPTVSRGNTESITDLETKHNFIITYNENDYELNEKWKVCGIKTTLSYLEKLNLLKND